MEGLLELELSLNEKESINKNCLRNDRKVWAVTTGTNQIQLINRQNPLYPQCIGKNFIDEFNVFSGNHSFRIIIFYLLEIF